MPGRSTFTPADHTGRAAAAAAHPPDPSVVPTAAPWAAVLRHPTTLRAGSHEPIVINVEGPVPLAHTTVEIGVEPREGGARRWRGAQWQTTTGTTGTCVTLLGEGALRLPPGWYHVLVRPEIAGQRPILTAGRLIVE